MTRADEERAYMRASAEDPSWSDHEAVAAMLIGHERDNVIGWTCSCGHRGVPGEPFHGHQADQVLALLRRRGALR